MKPDAFLIHSPFGTHIAAQTAEGWPAETVTPCFSGEQIRAVLEPFAALLRDYHSRIPPQYVVYAVNDAHITVGDLRRAKAMLDALS